MQNWKQPNHYVDIRLSDGKWYVARIRRIEEQFVQVTLDGLNEFPYSADSSWMKEFRSETGPENPGQTAVQVYTSQDVDSFKAQLDHIRGGLEGAFQSPGAVNQFFRGSFCFVTEYLVLAAKAENAQLMYEILGKVIDSGLLWMDYCRGRFEGYTEGGNEHLRDLHQAILHSWSEVALAMKMALGQDKRENSFFSCGAELPHEGAQGLNQAVLSRLGNAKGYLAQYFYEPSRINKWLEFLQDLPVKFYCFVDCFELENWQGLIDIKSVCERITRTLKRRLEQVTIKEDMKRIDARFFISKMREFNLEGGVFAKEKIEEVVVQALIRMVKSDAFGVKLQGLKILSCEIEKNEEYARLFYAPVIAHNGGVDFLFGKEVHPELMKNSATILGLLAETSDNFTRIMQKLVDLANYWNNEEFTAVLEICNAVSIKINENSLNFMHQLLASISYDSLSSNYFEILCLVIRNLIIRYPQHCSFGVDFIYKMALEGNDKIKGKAKSYLLNILMNENNKEIMVQFLNTGVQLSDSDDVKHVAGICIKLLEICRDEPILNRLQSQAQQYIEMKQKTIQPKEVEKLLKLTSKCIIRGESKLNPDFYQLFNALEKTLLPKFAGVYYKWLLSLVSYMTGKVEIQPILENLYINKGYWTIEACACFTALFQKINTESLSLLSEDSVPVRSAAHLEFEAELFDVYFSVSDKKIEKQLCSLISFLFTVMDPKFDLDARNEIFSTHFIKNVLFTGNKHKTCKLIEFILIPTTKTGYMSFDVTSNNGETASTKLRAKSRLRQLRLQIPELFNRNSYQFTLQFKGAELDSTQDIKELAKFFPGAFSVNFNEPDPYYFNPARAIIDNKQLKEYIVEALNSSVESFHLAFSILKRFYIPEDLKLFNGTTSMAAMKTQTIAAKLYLMILMENIIKESQFPQTLQNEVKAIGLDLEDQTIIPIIRVNYIERMLSLYRSVNYQGTDQLAKYLIDYSLILLDHSEYIHAIRLLIDNFNWIWDNIHSPQIPDSYEQEYISILKRIFKSETSSSSIKKMLKGLKPLTILSNSQQSSKLLQEFSMQAIESAYQYEIFWKILLSNQNAMITFVTTYNRRLTVSIGNTGDVDKRSHLLNGCLKLVNRYEKFTLPIKDLLEIIFQSKDTYQTFSLVKAKNQKTYKAGLKVIVRTCNNNEPALRTVLDFLIALHKTNPEAKCRPIRSLNFKLSEGFTGLKNLGCSCYMNSIIQQLYWTPKFRSCILSQPAGHEEIGELRTLFESLSNTDKKYLNPSSLFRVFRGYDGGSLNPYEQMDADEFLGILVNTLKGKLQGHSIETLLGGKFKIEIRCASDHPNTREEEFISIPIDVKEHSSLEESLESHIVPVVFEGNNQYHCDSCQGKVDANKYTFMSGFPETLIFTLKRFDFDYDTMERIKIHKFFEFNEEFTIPQGFYAADENIIPWEKQKHRYLLRGIVVHSGNAEGGHYISFVKVETNWVEFNDTVVNNVSWDDVKDMAFGKKQHCSAYILVYQQYNTTPQDDNIEINKSISDQNYKAFVKNRVFSDGVYSDFIKNLDSSSDLPDEFLIDYFLNIETRILESPKSNFEYFYNKLLPLASSCDSAHKIINWQTIQKYVLKCPISLVRRIMISLIGNCQLPLDSLILEGIPLIQSIVHDKDTIFITDFFRLLCIFLDKTTELSLSTEIQRAILIYITQKGQEFRMRGFYRDNSLMESIETSIDYSFHHFYNWLTKNTEKVSEEILTSMTSHEMTYYLMLFIKNYREAISLAKVYAILPSSDQALAQITFYFNHLRTSVDRTKELELFMFMGVLSYELGSTYLLQFLHGIIDEFKSSKDLLTIVNTLKCILRILARYPESKQIITQDNVINSIIMSQEIVIILNETSAVANNQSLILKLKMKLKSIFSNKTIQGAYDSDDDIPPDYQTVQVNFYNKGKYQWQVMTIEKEVRDFYCLKSETGSNLWIDKSDILLKPIN